MKSFLGVQIIALQFLNILASLARFLINWFLIREKRVFIFSWPTTMEDHPLIENKNVKKKRKKEIKKEKKEHKRFKRQYREKCATFWRGEYQSMPSLASYEKRRRAPSRLINYIQINININPGQDLVKTSTLKFFRKHRVFFPPPSAAVTGHLWIFLFSKMDLCDKHQP